MKIVRINKNLPLPKYQTPLSAGMDLYASIDSDITLKHEDVKVIPTGIKVQLPLNYEIQIRPRNELALRHRVTVLNSPGTIGADFMDEIKVMLVNRGYEDFTIHKGDRIAQAVVNQITRLPLMEVDELDGCERGKDICPQHLNTNNNLICIKCEHVVDDDGALYCNKNCKSTNEYFRAEISS